METALKTVINGVCIMIIAKYSPDLDMTLKMGIVSLAVALFDLLLSKGNTLKGINFFNPKLNTFSIRSYYNPTIYDEVLIGLTHRFRHLPNPFTYVEGHDRRWKFHKEIEHKSTPEMIDIIKAEKIVDTFEKNKIFISGEKSIVYKNPATGEETIDRKVIFTSKMPLQKIKQYITELVGECPISIKNTPMVCFAGADGVSEHTTKNKTSKTLETLILSPNVINNLVDDVKKFLENKKQYKEKGLPFRRGYLLYGPPGTGKTSIVKVLSKIHNMKIEVFNYKKGICIPNKSSMDDGVIVLIEDFHKDIFGKGDKKCPVKNNCSDKNKDQATEKFHYATLQDLINYVDGVVECSKTIFIITTNDEIIFKDPKFKPLFRPGRIDKIVKIDYCDPSQINRLIKLITGKVVDVKKLNINVTPAQIINILQDITNNSDVESTKFDIELSNLVKYLGGEPNIFSEIFDIETYCRKL